jgi:hypothetical protein
MTFKFSLSFSFILFFILGVAFFLFHVLHHPSAHEEYNALLEKARSHEPMEELSSYFSQHQREGIQKDVWMANQEQRLHLCLASNHSDLNFYKDTQKGEFVERMDRMTCSITEESLAKETSKTARTEASFNCSEAQFDYETMQGKLFSGADGPASFQTQIKNGKSNIPLKILSKEISIDAKQKTFTFDKPEGSLIVDPSKADPIRFTSDIMTWDESKHILILNGNVVIKDTAGQIYSDEVVVEQSLDDSKSVNIVLKGNVRIHNQYAGPKKDSPDFEQYALADKVVYDPQTKELVLSAENEKRVLFFDKINHLQVSGHTLKATRNPSTGKDTIKGSGDVRFTFAKQEWEAICKKFNLKDSHE